MELKLAFDCVGGAAPSSDAAASAAPVPTATPDPIEAALKLVDADPVLLLRAAKRIGQEAALALLAEANTSATSCSNPVSEADRQELVDSARLAGEGANALRAAGQVAAARYAAIDLEVFDADADGHDYVEKRLGHRSDWADVELGVACGWSARAASGRIDQAVSTLTRARELFGLVLDGRLELWRADLVASETSLTTPETAAQVQTRLQQFRGWRTWGYGKLQRTVRGLIAQLDADAVKQSRERTVRSETNVTVQPSLIAGIAELHATGPADQIARIAGAVDQLAAQRAHEEEDLPREQRSTRGQLELQALHDLVTEGCEITYDVTVQVPVVRGPAVLGAPPARGGPDRVLHALPPPAAHSDAPRGPSLDPCPPEQHPCHAQPPHVGWASVPGVGLIESDTLHAITGYFGARVARALVDATTGVTVETTKVGYAPSPAVRRFVQQRDGGCRAPGCSRPASGCALDHVVPWPAGDTTPSNLACLCKKHHQAKTDRRLNYSMTPDGVCTWTTPTGHTATTYPASVGEPGGC